MNIIVKLRDKVSSLFQSSFLTNVLIVALVTLVVKILGFFKEMEVGQTFGMSELLDTFLIALLIPGFIHNVFSVSFQNLFIPNYIAEQKQKGNLAGFQTACFLISICLSIFLISASYLVTDLYLEDFFKGHSPNYYSLIRRQFYILLPCILFWSFSSLLDGLLKIKGLFFNSSFYPIFTSIIILILLFFFKEQFGVYLLAFGLLLGSIFEFLYLLILSLVKKIVVLGRPNFKSTNLRVLLSQFPPKIGAGFLSGSTGFVNQFFAAQLVVGSLASFNFGLKLPSFLVSIAAVAIGNVILPYFSEIVFTDKKKAFQVLFKSVVYVFGVSIFVVGIFFIFSETIIWFLFEEGNFTKKDTVVVSQIQRILLLFVPFYVSGVILNKFLTSINRNVVLLYASMLNLVLNIVLNYYLAKLYGIYGLAFATTLVSIINFAVLYIIVYLQHKHYKKTS